MKQLFYFATVPVCNLDFSVSGAMPTHQFRTPAIPPANSTRRTLKSPGLQCKQNIKLVSGVRSFEWCGEKYEVAISSKLMWL